MTLYEDLIKVKQNIIGIRSELGDPRLKTVVFEYPHGDSLYYVITPDLLVTRPPDRMIGLPLDPKSNIMVNAEDYYIKDIPRSVPEPVLRTRAWLDPEYNNEGKIVRGINCRCHVINDKSGISYRVLFRKEREVKL